MNAQFKLVHFVADPFTGAKFPVAAIVRAQGRLEVARTPEFLDLGLARTSATMAAARFVTDGLQAVESFDRLPAAVGPHAELGEEREIPHGVTSPIDWVRDCVLRPAAPAVPQRAPSAAARGDAGYRFLKQWQVTQFVGRRLRARDVVRVPSAKALNDITHYVNGPKRLMLMEPVVLAPGYRSKSVRHIGTTFMAWQHALEHSDRAGSTDYVAYVLGNDNPKHAADVREVLGLSVAKVLDMNRSDERAQLLDTIRAAAA